jgi:TRAP-type C4-dicarboxylate transport system substrate-binding protein
MKKRSFRSICLILALVLVGAVLAACGDSNGTGGADEAAPAQTFTVHAAYAAGEPVTQSWTSALREIERRSGGRIEVIHYYAGSLLTFPEIPRGMLAGVAQWAYLPTVNYPDILPLNCRILQLPFMGMGQELGQFNMMAIAASPLWGYQLHLIDDNPVRLPPDLAGRTIVPYKPELIPVLERYGAGGSHIPPGQMYESLERGVIDGYINTWAFANWFNLHDFLNQQVLFGDNGMFQEFFIYVIAVDFYESMPADLRQIWHDVHRNERFSEFNGERGYEWFWRETEAFIEWQMNYAMENNHLIVELTPAEIQVWRDAIIGSHQTTLDTINGQRGDQVATAIYNRAREIITQRYG